MVTPQHLDRGLAAFHRNPPQTMAQAVRAAFAADDALHLACAKGVPDWQFNQLERQQQQTRLAAIEALQRAGVSRSDAERMLT